MIASLRGRLLEIEATGDHAAEVVVEVGGVGYRVVVGARLAAEVGPVGSEVAFSVHTHVREGALTLYGFASTPERRTFEVLVGAHGIGPALGIAILGVHSPSGLARAVAAGDVEALMTVPGVGRKTAQRLMVDLAGRLDDGGLAPGTGRSRGSLDRLGEVGAALAGLGYGPEEIHVALDPLDPAGDVEDLLREALRNLAPRR